MQEEHLQPIRVSIDVIHWQIGFVTSPASDKRYSDWRNRMGDAAAVPLQQWTCSGVSIYVICELGGTSQSAIECQRNVEEVVRSGKAFAELLDIRQLRLAGTGCITANLTVAM